FQFVFSLSVYRYLVKRLECPVEIIIGKVLSLKPYFQFIIDSPHIPDFRLRVIVAGSEKLPEAGKPATAGHFKGFHQEVGLFICHYVAAGLLTEQLCITICVKNVILNLEGDAKAASEFVKQVLVLFGSISDDCSHLEGSGHQHRRSEERRV